MAVPVVALPGLHPEEAPVMHLWPYRANPVFAGRKLISEYRANPRYRIDYPEFVIRFESVSVRESRASLKLAPHDLALAHPHAAA